MRLKVTMIAMALLTAGCATTQERFTALNHAAQVDQIYNQMTLENLANIMENPTTLPYFATLDSGIPQVADTGSFGGFWSFLPQTLVKQLHNQHGGQVGPLSASRSIQANWTLKPVNDDSRLRAMRYLYLWTLGKPIVDLAESDKLLSKYYPKNDCGEYTFSVRMVAQGWFRSGRWREVPHGTQYKLHHGGTFYWVAPGAEEEFTKFSLAMLHIALEAPKTKNVMRYYSVVSLEEGTRAERTYRLEGGVS